MQTTPHATFTGQVKNSSDKIWKKGTLKFYVDVANGSWTVKLYHSVNSNRLVQQQKLPLGKSAGIVFKCSRLIIGDKSNGELYIKVNPTDVIPAQRLVEKLTSHNVSTPIQNRAEVGRSITQNGHSGSYGKSPGYSSQMSSSLSNNSSGWLSKKNPPSSQTYSVGQTSSAKRKIQLEPLNGDSSDYKSNTNNGTSRLNGSDSKVTNGEAYKDEILDDWDIDDDVDNEVSFPKFTGMKDYSKRQQNKVTPALTNGLGASSFYGSQNTLIAENTYRGLGWKNSSSNQQLQSPRSPKIKRQKLSDIEADRENKTVVSGASKSLLKGALLTNRMLEKAPILSDPQEAASRKAPVGADNPDERGTARADTSGHISEAVGFDNLGNTCFMNSPLQCLSSLEPLSLDIQSVVSRFGRQLPHNSITRMLYLLMKDVRKLDVRPDRVREILTRLRHDINGKFEYNTQQDAHELLSELLDRTDEEVKALLSKSPRSQKSMSNPSSPSTSTNEREKDGTTNLKEEDAENKMNIENGEDDVTLMSTPTEANFTWFFKTSFYFQDCKTEVLSTMEEKDTTLMLALDAKTMNLQDCVDKYFESSEVDMHCEKCGKKEKATMTRKIIKRPRCFILNLLRYQAVQLGAKKKLDRVAIPRYMSVVEYCAEDVKAAPAIGPDFMLDRVPYDTNASLPSESAKMAPQSAPAIEAARLGKKVAMNMLSAMRLEKNKAREDMEEGEVLGEEGRYGEDKSGASTIKMKGYTEADFDLDRVIKKLANHLVDQFSEIDEHMELARRENEDFSDIHSLAHDIICDTRERVKPFMTQHMKAKQKPESDVEDELNLALCLALLKKAVEIPGEEEKEHDDDELYYGTLLKKLISLRYRSVKGHRCQINHLTEDLAVYLASRDVGVVVPGDSPKRRKLMSPQDDMVDGFTDAETETRRTSSDHSYKNGRSRRGQNSCQEEVYMEQDKDCSMGDTSLDVVGTSSSSAGERGNSNGDSKGWSAEKSGRNRIWRRGGSPAGEVSSSGDVEIYGEDSGFRRRSYSDGATSSKNRMRLVSGEEDSLSSRRDEGEESSSGAGALADVSNNATINTTRNTTRINDGNDTRDNASFDLGYHGDDMALPEKSYAGEMQFMGRPLGQWSERDLQSVNLDTLTEEDTMAFAMALSRLEYEKEQRNLSQAALSASSVTTANLADSTSFNDYMDTTTDLGCAFEDEDFVPADLSSKNSGIERSLCGSDDNNNKGTDSKDSKTAGDVFSMPRLCSDEKVCDVRKNGDGSNCNSKGSNAELGFTREKSPQLDCDLDEVDGGGDETERSKGRGLKGGHAVALDSSSNSVLKSGAARQGGSRVCQFCEHRGVRETLCESCEHNKNHLISPSAKSGQAAVLSPSKSQNKTPQNGNRSPSSIATKVDNSTKPGALKTSPRSHSNVVSPNPGGGAVADKSREASMTSPVVGLPKSPRKDTLSQAKSARSDLARLRSPSSASPRKRPSRDTLSATAGKSLLSSASKCLVFEDDKGYAGSDSDSCDRLLIDDAVINNSSKGCASSSPPKHESLESYTMQELGLTHDALGEDPDIHHSLGPSKTDQQAANNLHSPRNTPHKLQSTTLSNKSGSFADTNRTSSLSSAGDSGGPADSTSLHNTSSIKRESGKHQPGYSPARGSEESFGYPKKRVSTLPFKSVRDQRGLEGLPGVNSVKENVKLECYEELSDDQASPRRADEKENRDNAARRDRLESIEMGKADSSYRLVGIVNHHGESLFAGHYTAFSFNFNKQRWFFMDDKHARQTTEATARGESTNSGYVFFYMDKELFDQYTNIVSQRRTSSKGGSSS